MAGDSSFARQLPGAHPMTDWLLFVLEVAATFRATRLVVADDFPPIYAARRWICQARPTIRRKPITPRGPNGGLMFMREGDEDYWWAGELVTCPWCASGWIAAGVVAGATAVLSMPWSLAWLWWLAVWGAAAIVAERAS